MPAVLSKVAIYDKNTLDDAKKSLKRCVRTLLLTGIIKISTTCQFCGGADRIVPCDSKKDGFERYCNTCKKSATLRYDSMLYNSPKSMATWVDLLYAFTKDKSVDDSQDIAAYGERSVRDWFRIFRLCLALAFQDNLPEFDPNITKEIDESNFRITKYNRGKRKASVWVFGIVERGTNKVYLQVVANRKKRTLLPIIKRFIALGSTVCSDMCKAYACLANEGCQHFVVCHKEEFVNLDTGAHTQTIEGGVWSHCKTDYKKRRGCSVDDLSLWIMQWCFRRNFLTKTTPNENFHIVCQTVAQYYPIAKDFYE